MISRVTDELARVDEAYADLALARLYDAECPWHPQDDFYLALDLQAASVLDVGCGTGSRLVRAREVGHRGDLVGVDPAEGMLSVARGKTEQVRWVRGDAQTVDLGRRFALITMTGHAFQVLLDDAAVRAALSTFHRHLEPGARLAFETRNPAAKGWESWVAEQSRRVIQGPDGAEYEVWVDDPSTHGFDLISFTSVVRPRRAGPVRCGRSTLRFIDAEHLRALLTEAGFTVEGWYGDWDRREVDATSPEIVVVARSR